jgi:DNA polymerase
MQSADTLTLAELADILAFHVEAGVDCALDETPHDRFAVPLVETGRTSDLSAGRPAPALPRAEGRVLNRGPAGVAEAPRPALAGAAMSADDVARSATLLARTAHSLEALKQAMAGFEGCALKATAKSLCFSDGNPAARIMLVGEAPGADEDRLGLPFVGVSGQLLDRMLAAIGLSRANDVYIANIVPWRPPGNRTPTTQEMMICKPFIERQIELAAPDILVTVGGPSSQALLGIPGIMAARGKWREYQAGGRMIPALPTLHPAYLLRNPIAKRQSWLDLRSLRQAFDALPPRG